MLDIGIQNLKMMVLLSFTEDPYVHYLSSLAAIHQQLLEYEGKLFGSSEAMTLQLSISHDSAASESLPSFGFGFPKAADTSSAPMFNQPTSSILERSIPNVFGNDFVFGAERNIEQRMMETGAFVIVPPNASETPMDSS